MTLVMACFDEGLSLHYPQRLPLLFNVDATLAIPDGQHWVLNCEHSACTAGAACVRHALLPNVPDWLPKQVRFDVRRSLPLADKTDLGLDTFSNANHI